MPDVNVLAVLAATVVAFVMSAAYYMALGDQLASVSDAAAADGDQLPAWKVGAELARSLVVAAVLAGLASRTETDTWTGGLLLGLVLWIGFPAVLWAGAMLHERTPWRLAAIHGGDWLLKLLAVTVVVSAWQ